MPAPPEAKATGYKTTPGEPGLSPVYWALFFSPVVLTPGGVGYTKACEFEIQLGTW